MSKFHLKEKIFPFPNNLIIEWLEKKFLNAKEKALNSRFTYKKALDSLKKYPLAIKELSELKVIQNIGKGMIDKLEESWEELIKNYQEKIPITNTANEVSVESKVSTTENAQRTTLPKRRRSISLENISFSNNDDIFFSQNNLKNKAYIPRYRSGPYALLLTLLKSNEKVPNESVSKTDLIRKAQPLCDSSFTIPAPPGSFKTAWMGMSTLLKKELVIKVSTRPCRYMATNTGIELAQKLARAAKEMSEKSQSENTETVNDTSLINPLEQSTFILEDDYDILLLVDNNEYYGP
ncbi:hypothetical protein HZS_6497 [Henneguya salminicola]|nr:hypothetical protein HZS_6497 [Henneguya salminicola]